VAQVIAAMGKANGNVGGQTINFGPQAAIVRGVGLIQSSSRSKRAGGHQCRRPGAAARCGQVRSAMSPHGHRGPWPGGRHRQGIVLMRAAQSMPTINAVKAEVDKINAAASCPRRPSGSASMTAPI
jgi:cobalt-zinc-cadmium resistance protein CzcA